MPKVSVVIPTCNRPELLKRALRSVLAQSYQDFEIIVVDDGTESAAEAVASFRDARIHYLKNEGMHGGGAARNRGIEQAKGEFVAFLDDDDEWFSEKLSKQVSALNIGGEKVGASFSGLVIFDNATEKEIYTFLPNESGIVDIFDRTLFRCFIWTSVLLVRRNLLMEERFNPEFPKNQEWDLQLRLAKRTNFFGINEVLTRLNVLGKDEHLGGSGNAKNIARGYELLLQHHASDFAQAPKARARQNFLLGVLYRDLQEYAKMKRCFYEAVHAYPWNPAYLRHYFASFLGTRVYLYLFSRLSKPKIYL